MEKNDLKRKIIKLFVLIIMLVLFIFFVRKLYWVSKVNDQYTDKVEYNEDKQFHYEDYGNYSVAADRANILDKEISVSVEYDDVFYDEKHPEITVSLVVYVNINGVLEYCIGFCDEEDESFGGNTFVTESLEMIPENVYDKKTFEKNQEYMELTKETINKIVDIANEKWDLNLQKIK